MTIEGRRGIYEPRNCDARIWTRAPGRYVSHDNVQCSSKKADGTCFCKRHNKKIVEFGSLWLGSITEPRPEKPIGPPGTKAEAEQKKRGITCQWSTDEEGNDIVFETKEKVWELKRINAAIQIQKNWRRNNSLRRARKSIEGMIKEIPSLANVKMIINGEELEGFFMKK